MIPPEGSSEDPDGTDLVARFGDQEQERSSIGGRGAPAGQKSPSDSPTAQARRESVRLC